MNTSDLNDTLNGQVSGQALAEKISSDVTQYALLLKKKGSTIPLNFIEDKEIFLSRSSIGKLFGEVLSGNLSNVDLAYICDCLTLGESVFFETENLKDIIFDLADPEINGGFKKTEEIADLLNRLQ